MRIILDIAFDAPDTLDLVLADLMSASGADVTYEVVTSSNASNGWPTVTFEGDEHELVALMRVYDADPDANAESLEPYLAG